MIEQPSVGVTSKDKPIYGFPPRRIIQSCQGGGPLLTRYFLFRSDPISIYLHHLHISDEDRCLHDHPWAFVTFLLSSGYFEHTPDGRFWRRRFSALYRPAEWKHRLELVRPTWTLIVRFRRVRDWGFWLPSGWMNWRDYGRNYCD